MKAPRTYVVTLVVTVEPAARDVETEFYVRSKLHALKHTVDDYLAEEFTDAYVESEEVTS